MINEVPLKMEKKSRNQERIMLAKINEAYHRKQMEYFQEEIRILEKKKKVVQS
jgi:hypothetical protein